MALGFFLIEDFQNNFVINYDDMKMWNYHTKKRAKHRYHSVANALVFVNAFVLLCFSCQLAHCLVWLIQCNTRSFVKGLWYRARSTLPRMHMCICAGSCGGGGKQRLEGGVQGEEGGRERKEGRHPEVEEVSDDSCIAELLPTQRFI